MPICTNMYICARVSRGRGGMVMQSQGEFLNSSICTATFQYLLVEHHVHPVRSNVSGELAQEGEYVFDGGRVGQPAEPQAVSHTARRGQERHGGQHRHQGSRRHRDEGGRGVPVQHLHVRTNRRLGDTCATSLAHDPLWQTTGSSSRRLCT